ncbi:MAG TPA: phenylacetaldoxime dehydratase family protein [Edaphobacter sp.]|nr:phenylacetaldoxime dehydratase family protein [Edaphobacter sp.]
MPTPTSRQTVDLSQYPDLVVVYLGMRVNRLTGLKTLAGFGPKISGSVAAHPDGLLLHENIIYSLFPMHVGMRQYWRDMETLLSWTRSEPHREWWKSFLRDSGGTGFWHETYLMQGGMEAVYVDVAEPIGMMRFAPVKEARGTMFGASHRVTRSQHVEPVVSEDELYGSSK